MILEITQHHIDVSQAIPPMTEKRCNSCPIAQALREVFPNALSVDVGPGRVYVWLSGTTEGLFGLPNIEYRHTVGSLKFMFAADYERMTPGENTKAVPFGTSELRPCVVELHQQPPHLPILRNSPYIDDDTITMPSQGWGE